MRTISAERERELREQASVGLDLSPADPLLVDALALCDDRHREAQEIITELNDKVQYLVDYLFTLEALEDGFTFPDGDHWEPSKKA